MSQVLPLGRPGKDVKLDTTPIAGIAFNGDGTQMAVVAEDELRIYASGKPWTLMHTLKDHTLKISGVDWHAKTNRIVTASHDRNAFVWEHDKDSASWIPTLVIVRCNRGLMCVKWSPDGLLMAIGSADKTLSVCDFAKAENFWVSKKQKCKSTVTCLSWMADSRHLVIGSTDYKIRLVYYTKKSVDANPPPPLMELKKKKDGLHVLQEWEMDSWPQSIACSPDSSIILACDAGSNFHVYSVKDGETTSLTFPVNHLPFRTLAFLNSAGDFVAAGYDRKPIQFNFDGENFKETEVDVAKAKSEKSDNKLKAMEMFTRATTFGNTTGGFTCNTKHQNVITSIWMLSEKKYATADLSGAVWTWDKK